MLSSFWNYFWPSKNIESLVNSLNINETTINDIIRDIFDKHPNLVCNFEVTNKNNDYCEGITKFNKKYENDLFNYVRYNNNTVFSISYEKQNFENLFGDERDLLEKNDNYYNCKYILKIKRIDII